MNLTDVKRYCTQTLAALDPRMIGDELTLSTAVWSSSQPGKMIDIYAGYKDHEKVAIIMKPYFKILGYLALASLIICAALPLCPAVAAATMTSSALIVVLGAILTVGAYYVEDPNYFEPTWKDKTKNALDQLKNKLSSVLN